MKGYDLTEFEDFTLAEAFGKKTVFINGNCYASIIGDLLKSNRSFTENYYIFDIVPFYDFDDSREKYISNCDICISQDILSMNRYSSPISEAFIKKHLKIEGKLIIIPDLFGLGRIYFIQGGINGKK